MGKFKILQPTEDEMKKAHENYIHLQKTNRNNFSNWFWKLHSVVRYGIHLPKSVTVPVSENILPAFFQETEGDGKKIREWVEKILQPLMKNVELPAFMKNGCFSNKFDFSNSCLIESIDTDYLARHLGNIQYNSLCYDTLGNLEIVLREWIAPEKGAACIYNGMPLRPEMRLFYDFSNHKYLYDVNYWDWDYCHDVIARRPADKDAYEKAYPSLVKSLENYRDRYLSDIKRALAGVEGLEGVWSVDFMFNDGKVWLIDMAEAQRSAYWDPSKVK